MFVDAGECQGVAGFMEMAAEKLEHGDKLPSFCMGNLLVTKARSIVLPTNSDEQERHHGYIYGTV